MGDGCRVSAYACRLAVVRGFVEFGREWGSRLIVGCLAGICRHVFNGYSVTFSFYLPVVQNGSFSRRYRTPRYIHFALCQLYVFEA